MHRFPPFLLLSFASCCWSATFPIHLPQSPIQSPGIVSIWLKANDPVSEDARVALIQKAFSEKGESRDHGLAYSRISRGDWTRLSGWIPRPSPACPPPQLLLESKNEVSFSVGRVSWETLPDSPPVFPQGFVRVGGALLRNNAGPLLFRGINVAAYSDDEKDKPHEALAKVTGDDYREIASLGFNAVRLACWQKLLDDESGMDWLKLQVALARKYGLYTIIDLHVPAGGYQSNDYKGPFWEKGERGEKLRGRVADCWEKIATVFKDEPAVAAYDLINEPHPKNDSQWFDFAKFLIRAIRETGDAHPIVVETSMLDDSSWKKFEDDSIIYDTHWYLPWEFVSQNEKKPFGDYGKEHRLWGENVILNKDWLAARFAPYSKWCKEQNVPMQVGEYGISAGSELHGGLLWLGDMVSLFEEDRVSRFYWCWHPFDMGLRTTWWRRENGGFRVRAAAIAVGKAD